MKFPEKYKCLEANSFSDGAYTLVPIRYEDRMKIMQWRNEQIYHLRQNKPLTEEDQENYFRNVVSKLFEQEKPDQILFSYLKEGECIGYGGLVHINWMDRNAEISFIMATHLEENDFEFHWTTYLKLIEKVAFVELKLHKLYTYAFDIRPHLYLALEKVDYVKEAVLKEHCCFNNVFKDVVIHSKLNNEFTLRKVNESDLELTYKWANDEETRRNSFNSEMISFSNHKSWFDQKINNESANYFIAEIKGKPCGFIRFDTIEDQTTIGILIDKDFRGKGLASKILKKSCENFLHEFNNKIFAYIKPTNLASCKSFEKAGFKFLEETNVKGVKALKYVYEQ